MLAMSRSTWDALRLHEERPVILDVAETPLAGLAGKAIAAVAKMVGVGQGQVEIYRYDEKDEPMPVNVDRYTVVADAASRWSIPSIVNAASTEANDNLRAFLQGNVFIVKESPGDDHWLPSIPAEVEVVIRNARLK